MVLSIYTRGVILFTRFTLPQFPELIHYKINKISFIYGRDKVTLLIFAASFLNGCSYTHGTHISMGV